MKILLSLAVLLMCFGCTYDYSSGGRDTTIKLTAVHEFSGEVLPDQLFEFSDCSSKKTLLGLFNSCKTKKHVTDANGNIFIEFTTEAERSYSISFRGEGESWSDLDFMAQKSYDIKEGRDNKITCPLTPTARLGIRITQEPLAEFTRIDYKIKRKAARNDPYVLLGNWGAWFDRKIDTVVYQTVMQDKWYKIEGQLSNHKTNTVKKTIKEFKVARKDSETYHLKYES